MIGFIARRDFSDQLRRSGYWGWLALCTLVYGWWFAQLLERYGLGVAIQQPIGVSQALSLQLFSWGALLILLYAPLLAATACVDERNNGTLQLLRGSPLRDGHVLFGKYLGVMMSLAYPLCFPLAISLSLAPFTQLDYGLLLAAFLGLALLALAFAALTLAASMASRTTLGAITGGYALLLGLTLLEYSGGEGATGWSALSWNYHLFPLLHGLLRGEDLVYFSALTLAALAFGGFSWVRQRPGRLVNGALTTWLLALLLVALVIGLIDASARHSDLLDVTRAGQHRLAPATQAVLSRLHQPLRLTAYVPPSPVLEQQIRLALAPYQGQYPDFQLSFVNPLADTGAGRELNLARLGQVWLRLGSVEEQLLQLTEPMMVNTLLRLSNRQHQRIVFIGGHGERKPLGAANRDLGDFAHLLEQQGFQVQMVQLPELAEVPAGTDLLVIASSERLWLPGEEAKVQHFLRSGGHVLWLAEPPPAPWLHGLAETLGLAALPGQVVNADAARLGLVDPGFVVISDYPQHPMLQGFRELALFPGALALETVGGHWEGRPLLLTSDQSWNETAPLQGLLRREADQGEMPGPLVIGWTLELGPQRVAVLGDGDFLSNSYLGNGANRDLGLRLMRWLLTDEHF